MFISEAYAQAAATPQVAGSGSSSILMLIAMFAILWLFVIRPQAKRHKEHMQLVSSLKRGDKVVTDSGIYGVISKVKDESIVEVEIAEGVRIELVRNAVAAVTGSAKVKSESKPEKKTKTKKKAS